ncbi:MAG: hypothetical protein RIB98_05685 [Acidimicrobiales bacterium]
MTALAIVLLSVGVGDLTHGLAGMPVSRRRAVIATGFSIATAITGTLLVGAAGGDAMATAVIAIIVSAAWQLVRVGFSDAMIQLGTIGAGVVAAVMVSTVHLEDGADSVWRSFLDESRIHLIQREGPVTVLLVLALGVVLISTANAVVRIVLEVVIDGEAPTTRIRGGRVIGSLERLLILGFVLAGQPTTAALVVTAKSLLRYPELRAHDDVDIHAVTEYVLIGSLVSWTLALGATLVVV